MQNSVHPHGDIQDVTAEDLSDSLQWHLHHTLAVSQSKETDGDWYLAFSVGLRDQLAERWMKTQDCYAGKKVRRAYYLSLEFLIGRLLGNNAMNMGLYDKCREALADGKLSWEDMQEMERDPGLGNGGLGRLAACFVDSLATLHLPCIGYGLRYDYGLFRQQIVNGAQVEEPDTWKKEGYPWEFKRPGYAHTVCFGGETRQMDVNGKLVWRWFPAERVTGMPYDIPVVGYGGRNVNNLRLWSAEAYNEFDFQDFNEGSYEEAVDSKIRAENLTKVLYPNDNIQQGKELRLRQQYFFVACSLHDILRRHFSEGGTVETLPEKVTIQLNDTHPTLVIPEMMRILVDERGVEWGKAWEITRACVNYTNHTILPEALEKWSVPLFRYLLPRHLQIIFDINSRFLEEVSSRYPGDLDKLRNMSVIEEGGEQSIRMANLAVIGSTHVNGVAEIHSRILKEVIFKDFAEMWPGKFTNMTNGITQRRWLLFCNRPLARLITSRIGDGWITDLFKLRDLEKFIEDDGEFLRAFGDAANCCSCGVCEMFACPMGLSPRKVNEYMKVQLRERGIQVPRNMVCEAHEDINLHRIPTGRLVTRLGLADYYGKHAHECLELEPEAVFVPFSQHIGKPAVPVKNTGDTVEAGELLAAAAEGGLSANIHASITGVITEITPAGARIARRKEG